MSGEASQADEKGLEYVGRGGTRPMKAVELPSPSDSMAVNA